VAGEHHSEHHPAPATSIAALRRILETVDAGKQPHAYGVLRAQLDEAIGRKMTDQAKKRR
jgi:hypothetical protein